LYILFGENLHFSHPPLIADLENVLAVFADGFTSFALKAEGTLVAWGHPLPGQPEVLPLLKNVSAFSVYWGCAVAALGDAPPPAGIPLRNLAWTDDGFAFEFTPPRNSVYSIEQSDSLKPIQWTALPLVRGERPRYQLDRLGSHGSTPLLSRPQMVSYSLAHRCVK
jgi:hypothetical protein